MMMAQQSNDETKAAAADNLPFAAVKTLSVNELRTAVEAYLKQSGALNRLKTELRGMMLEGVLKETKMRRARAKQPRSSCNAAGVCESASKVPISSHINDEEYDSLENFEKMRSVFVTQDAQNEEEPKELTTDHLVATPPLPDENTQMESSVQHENQELREEEEEQQQQQQLTHFAFQKWCAHVADALVAHHLRITERQLTYSLFVNEAVVLPLTNCGVREEEDEVLRKMLLLPSSSSFTSSHHGTSTSGDANVANICEDDRIYRQIRMRDASKCSVLQSLIKCNLLHQRKINNYKSCNTNITCTNRTIGTQTEHNEFAENVLGGRHQELNDYFSDNKKDNKSTNKQNGYAPLTTLEARLAAVDVKHALEMSHIQRSRRLFEFTPVVGTDGRECRSNRDLYCYTPSATPLSFQLAVERRLETYKQEMHAQLRKEYEMKYERFERETLEQAKQEATQNFAVRINNMTEAMAEEKRALEMKLTNERQALMILKESLEAERAQLLKSQRAMVEERMQHDEVNTLQLTKLRECNEKALLTQVKCAKWEELASSRLVELNQLKRKVQSLTSHIERMYADYAHESDAKNDEIARLQFRVRMLLSEHIDVNNSTPICSNKHHDEYNKENKNEQEKPEDIINKKTTNTTKLFNKNNNDRKSNIEVNMEKVISAKELASDVHSGKHEISFTTSNSTNNDNELNILNHDKEECERKKDVPMEVKQNVHVNHGDALPSTSPAVKAVRDSDEDKIGRDSNDLHSDNSNFKITHNITQVQDEHKELEQEQEKREHNNETKLIDLSKNMKREQLESANSSYMSSESSDATQSSKHSSSIINKESVQQNMPSSSSSSTTSSSSTSSSTTYSKEKYQSSSESMRAKENANANNSNVLEEIKVQLNNIVNKEEIDERSVLLQEEQEMWNGIAWTHKSQLSLITEREKNTNPKNERSYSKHNERHGNTNNNDSDSDNEIVAAASPISLFARMQRAEAAQERKNFDRVQNVDSHVKSSDDTDEFSEDEADELLFAKNSSSSSSSFE